MKANELRIGNWVLNDTQYIIKNGYDIDFAHIYKPIPLTPEILLKCGFESVPHYTVMGSMTFKIGRGRVLSIGCVGTPNEILFITEEESIIVLHNFDYDGKLYLHRLQNIIHSLANTELIYKH